MFEHFTEKARRVIFFARHEASEFGSNEITPEHLLLGFLRENFSVANQYFHSPGAPESIRKRLEEQLPRGEKLSTSADLPLSNEARRVLAHAIEASIRLKHKDVTPAHLLMGLLQLENSLAARVLRDHEVTIPEITEKTQKAEFTPQSETVVTASAGSVIAETCRDLTAAAEQAAFPPLIGREPELQTLMQVLGRRSGNNPVLVGEPGVGKTTIVEALAQRIADHRVPEFLREKRILALAPGGFADSPDHRREFERRFRDLVVETAPNLDLILFIDGLFDSSSRPASPFAPVLGRLLAALSFSQCIATGTPAGFKAAIERDPVIERHFRAIPISPPGENDTIRILAGLKKELEQYHGVSYDASAIETATRASVQFMPRSPLPGGAIGLLDEAGARVKLRLEKQKVEDASLRTVTGADVEAVVSEMTGLSVETIRQRLGKKLTHETGL